MKILCLSYMHEHFYWYMHFFRAWILCCWTANGFLYIFICIRWNGIDLLSRIHAHATIPPSGQDRFAQPQSVNRVVIMAPAQAPVILKRELAYTHMGDHVDSCRSFQLFSPDSPSYFAPTIHCRHLFL